jgi:predicted transcriptional regulator
MEILWGGGEFAVREVVDRLERSLAYTTVMTTLDRLFKKGLLDRRKRERAFFYSATYTRGGWEQKRAGELLAGFPPRLLISCLVDVAGEHDEALLAELERKIRQKRKELDRRKP